MPVMILARLAVDRGHQGQGLGKALLKDALLRTAQAADIAGVRCLLVHAKDEAGTAVVRVLGIRSKPDRSIPPVLDAERPQSIIGVMEARLATVLFFESSNPTAFKISLAFS